MPFPLLQYVREIDPLPFHNVYEIRILCSYLAWSHFYISICLLHGARVSLVSPSIGFVLPPYPIPFLVLSVSSLVACSLTSLSFVFSFPPSSSLLVLSCLSTLFLASRFLPIGVLLCFLLALFLFGFINPSSFCCSLVFSTSCFLMVRHSLIRCPCS
jgi:hypothetical protein